MMRSALGLALAAASTLAAVPKTPNVLWVDLSFVRAAGGVAPRPEVSLTLSQTMRVFEQVPCSG